MYYWQKEIEMTPREAALKNIILIVKKDLLATKKKAAGFIAGSESLGDYDTKYHAISLYCNKLLQLIETGSYD